jgi:hypothetical protein
MKLEPAAALTLAAVIRNDLQAIAALELHAGQLPASGMRRVELESLGFALHNLYNALENSFTQISMSFENHVRDQTRWHRELLEKLFLDLGALRPAVFPVSARPLLTELLGFRHLFRHAYDFTLDEGKTIALWNRWRDEGPVVKESLAGFAALLARIGEGA